MHGKAGPRGSVRFTVACLAVLALGCALRLQTWQQPEMPAPAAGVPVIAAQPEPAAGLAAPPQVLYTLIDFYDRLDRGRYAELYDTVFESRWQLAPDGSCTYAGLTGRDEFVADVGKEFEANGAGINVMSYRMTAATLLAESDVLGDALPELAVLGHLPEGMQLKAIYRTEVEGDLGPACLPASWRKTLYVANFAPDDWRLLLATGAGVPRKTQWFGNGTVCGTAP